MYRGDFTVQNHLGEWIDKPCYCCDDFTKTHYMGDVDTQVYSYVPDDYILNGDDEDVTYEDLGASIRRTVFVFDIWRCPHCGETFRGRTEQIEEEITFKDELVEDDELIEQVEDDEEPQQEEESPGLLERILG